MPGRYLLSTRNGARALLFKHDRGGGADQRPLLTLAEVDGGTMISAGGGLIPTFGAVDISHFRLISANTKRLFRSDQSTSAVFLVTRIPRNSFLPNCRSFPNTIY